MKPLGRKYYKDKTGGKHHVRHNGKYDAWWLSTCEPNTKTDRVCAKMDIQTEIEEFVCSTEDF